MNESVPILYVFILFRLAGFLCLPQIFQLALASGRLCLGFSRSRLENTAVFLKYVAKSNELLLQCEYKIKKEEEEEWNHIKQHSHATTRSFFRRFISMNYFRVHVHIHHGIFLISLTIPLFFFLFHLELHRNLILFIFIALEHTHDFLFLLLIIYRQSLGFRWGF